MNYITVNINPVIFDLGMVQVRWYGLMYVFGFLLGGHILARLSRENFFRVPVKKIDVFITYLIIGMFIGARLTYVFVYNWDYYSENLVELFSVWKGGLSFHGALLGLIAAAVFFAKQNKLSFFEVTDSMAVAGTPGLLFGRLGNFINGELYGRTTDVAWGMIFKDGGPSPRHPSQLYEGILEGLVLFIIFYAMRKKVKYHGTISALFMILYGVFRFIVEFFREPDAQLGYLFGGATMGQLLCFIMIFGGVGFFFYSRKYKIKVHDRV